MKFLVVAIALSAAQAQNFPVQIIGAEGEVPETAFPLGKCMGDCNRHRDCEGTLMCFARGGATTVPGCEGELPMDGTDICWDPNDRIPAGVIANIGRNGNPPQLFPLQQCQGSCSTDEHCAEGLVCFFRSAIVNTVPGCEGEPLPDGADYCVRPEDLPYGVGGGPPAPVSVPAVAPGGSAVTPVVDLAEPTDATDPAAPIISSSPGVLSMAPSDSSLPLQHCQGDCDDDTDCDEGLACFLRETEEVPGCTGLAASLVDYCIKTEDIPKQIEEPTPVTTNPTSGADVYFTAGIFSALTVYVFL